MQATPGLTHHTAAELRVFMSLCCDEMPRASKSIEAEYRLWFPRTEGELAKEMEFPYQNMIKVF